MRRQVLECVRASAAFHAPMKLKVWHSQNAPLGVLSPLAHWNNSIRGLILGAGGDIVLGQGGQKPFQFMFIWHTQRQPFEKVAISPEPGAASALGRECKMLASNNFRKPLHCCVRIHLAVVIHEQPVVY
jgi:hypothetical protein